MTPVRPQIELHIEELVLHGTPTLSRDSIAAQLISALAAGLAERELGAWAVDGAAIEQLRAEVTTSASNTAPGASIGHAIAGALTRIP